MEGIQVYITCSPLLFPNKMKSSASTLLGIKYSFVTTCGIRAGAKPRGRGLGLQLFENFTYFGYSLDFNTKAKACFGKN